MARLQASFVAPFSDFFTRYRWQALLILGLIGIYRISDVVMGIMANPFYVDMGYTKEEVAAVTKVFGVIMTLLGGFVGGTMAVRWGVMRVLMLGAVLSAGTNMLFAWLATRGHDVSALVWVVPLLLLAAYFTYFFRNPSRTMPTDDHLLVSPADGTVVGVEEVEEDAYLNQKCRKIIIFLSIFDAHVNRAPLPGTIDFQQYTCGRFRPAYKEGVGYENERYSTQGNEQSFFAGYRRSCHQPPPIVIAASSHSPRPFHLF